MVQTPVTRRGFVGGIPFLGASALAFPSGLSFLAPGRSSSQDGPVVHPEFPAQSPSLVREMVGVSHGNVARVKELLSAHPALAKASWDWGFGDHETALGAASHVGNREIAMLLLSHGAAPTLFSATMLGQLDIVRAMVEAHRPFGGLEVQRIAGPHGITLLAHARAGGEQAKPVREYLESLGNADSRAADLTLSDEDRARCAGTYAFGEGDNDRLIVEDDRGSLWIKRGTDGTRRGLFHAGNLEFTPAGAPAVRIRFEVDGDGVSRLSVIDGPWTLEAGRTLTN